MSTKQNPWAPTLIGLLVSLAILVFGGWIFSTGLPSSFNGSVTCNGQVMEGWDHCAINSTEYDYTEMKERQLGADPVILLGGLAVILFGGIVVYVLVRDFLLERYAQE